MISHTRRTLVFGSSLAPLTTAAAAAASATTASAPRVVVYPRMLERPANAYGFQVLDLALQRSGLKYELRLGDELISARAAWMSVDAGLSSVIDNGTMAHLAEQYEMVAVPIDFGLGGCRRLLARREMLARLHNVHRLQDLQPFQFGQGRGWIDTGILRKAGLRVSEGDFDALVRMLQGRRFDLLPLGADEAYGLLERSRAAAPDVGIHTGVGLLYPYLRVFYVRRGDDELHDALTRGLKAAHADGSLLALLTRTPGIGDTLSGKYPLPTTLIGMKNPWLPADLSGLSIEHFYPPLRPLVRPLLPSGAT